MEPGWLDDHRMMPADGAGGDVWTFAGAGKPRRVVEARLGASPSTFLLKEEETPDFWPEESARTGTSVTCHDQVGPMHRRHLNVFNKERGIRCAPPRGVKQRRQGRYNYVLGGAQQTLT
jgi:hypothetical protein